MNRKMKVKTILTLALAATTLAACHRGKKPPRMDNSKLAISLSKPAKGDRAIYGLACLGCSDTALVLLPNGGGDPVRYNILDATRNHQVFGDIEVGDWVCVMPCEEKDEKNRADMVIDLDQLKVINEKTKRDTFTFVYMKGDSLALSDREGRIQGFHSSLDAMKANAKAHAAAEKLNSKMKKEILK